MKRQKINGRSFQLRVNLPYELVERIREVAFQRRETMAFFVRKILESALEAEETE